MNFELKGSGRIWFRVVHMSNARRRFFAPWSLFLWSRATCLSRNYMYLSLAAAAAARSRSKKRFVPTAPAAARSRKNTFEMRAAALKFKIRPDVVCLHPKMCSVWFTTFICARATMHAGSKFNTWQPRLNSTGFPKGHCTFTIRDVIFFSNSN